MRTAEITRNTFETNISLTINLDGKGNHDIDTGIGFFDHMLTHVSKHGFIDLNIKAKGDLYVDCHHTIEDVGIVLGKAIANALGDKKGIKRYGLWRRHLYYVLWIFLVDHILHLMPHSKQKK